MPFPSNVKEDVLVACGRYCCVCHKHRGLKIEVHHIREESEGGDNSADNAIPLCFDCHADMRSYDYQHPKGNKYTENELKRLRDNLYEKVKGNIGVANGATDVKTDKQVYQALIKILPWDGSINFIEAANFEFSFESAKLNDLFDFQSHCKNPAFEFIDPDLEQLRSNLLVLINDFIQTILTETFSTNNSGRYSVPEEWVTEQPERFRRVVKILHNTASKIVETYTSIVKTSTRKLGILPPMITQ